MGWIKTDYDFGYPAAEFTLSLREKAVIEVRDAMKVNQDDPAAMEKFIGDLVAFYRPNLKGGVVVGIAFFGFQFRITYAHPDLPRVKFGEQSPSEPLIPQERCRDGILIHDEPLHRICESVEKMVLGAETDVRYGGGKDTTGRDADQPVIRRGVTLIELLVVIAIIGVLVGLLLPAVGYVRTTAKRTACVAELQQVGVAASLFNGEYGVHPRSWGGGPNGEFRLCTRYTDASGNVVNWPEVAYLKRVFPRMDLGDNGLRAPGGRVVDTTSPELLDGNQAFMFFLTGGTYTDFQGFSNDKHRPFLGASSGEARKAFFDVNAGKFTDKTTGVVDGRLRDPWGSPYAFLTPDPAFRDYDPARTCYGVSAYSRGGKSVNQGTFQVVSAGRDMKFGPGGAWVPGQGSYSGAGVGWDDVANFQGSPLGVPE
jgi:prepilin-type N-terminal cleavage/methylation domain-containing protein